jgi:hypothetical protein
LIAGAGQLRAGAATGVSGVGNAAAVGAAIRGTRAVDHIESKVLMAVSCDLDFSSASADAVNACPISADRSRVGAAAPPPRRTCT